MLLPFVKLFVAILGVTLVIASVFLVIYMIITVIGFVVITIDEYVQNRKE